MVFIHSMHHIPALLTFSLPVSCGGVPYGPCSPIECSPVRVVQCCLGDDPHDLHQHQTGTAASQQHQRECCYGYTSSVAKVIVAMAAELKIAKSNLTTLQKHYGKCAYGVC